MARIALIFLAVVTLGSATARHMPEPQQELEGKLFRPTSWKPLPNVPTLPPVIIVGTAPTTTVAPTGGGPNPVVPPGPSPMPCTATLITGCLCGAATCPSAMPTCINNMCLEDCMMATGGIECYCPTSSPPAACATTDTMCDTGVCS